MRSEILHRLWESVSVAMSSWHQGKLFVEHAISVSHDTLHLIVGVLIWVVAALLSRRPLTSWIPWLWVLAFILWNEAADLIVSSLEKTIAQKRVTYDFERLMEGATLTTTSGFANTMVANM